MPSKKTNFISNTPPFKVGDLVTSNYWKTDNVIRRVTDVYYTSYKWFVSADGGKPCPTCNKQPSAPISNVPYSWFKKATPNPLFVNERADTVPFLKKAARALKKNLDASLPDRSTKKSRGVHTSNVTIRATPRKKK